MIETRDLVLGKAVFEDWQDMYERVWSREETARYMLWELTDSEEKAKDRMERTLVYQGKNPTAFTVYEKKIGRAIGFAGMMEIEPGVFEDTGVALGPEYVGRGYGRQILSAIVEAAFRDWGAEKLICSCRSENAASRRLQIACGFQFSHSEERIDPRNGERYVLEFYELVK